MCWCLCPDCGLPLGCTPVIPRPFFFFCSNSLTQHHSAKFSFKVLPGIYIKPIKEVGGGSGAQACSDFSVSVDSNVMLHFKSEFTYVAHSSDLTVPRISDFSFSNSHHGRVWSAAEECFPRGGDERWSSLLSGTFQGRQAFENNSAHVCAQLITATLVSSLKAVKWENPRAPRGIWV